MKLRYYMRGLGIGILVTALLFVLSGRTSKSLSDQQILERAAELGMVMEDKSVLKENAAEVEQEEATPEPVKQVEQSKEEKVEEPKQEETKQEETEQEETEQEESIKEEIPQEEPKQEETKQEEQKQKETVSEETDAEETVTITVPGGASSLSVAKQIEQAGLVDSAAEFDSYLCKNGYDKKICVGSHVIPKNATEEEIAKALTGK